jgi:hypothetical protein
MGLEELARRIEAMDRVTELDALLERVVKAVDLNDVRAALPQ